MFPSLPESFLLALTDVPLEPSGFGSCVKAIACGQTITCPDIEADQVFDPRWRQVCLDYGLKSARCAATRIELPKRYSRDLVVILDLAVRGSHRQIIILLGIRSEAATRLSGCGQVLAISKPFAPRPSSGAVCLRAFRPGRVQLTSAGALD